MDSKINNMKKIILLFAIFINTILYSQYNLEFNRVLTFQLAGYQEIAVPEGKVWKIESTQNEANSAGSNYFRVKSLGNNGFPPNRDTTLEFYDGVSPTIVWLKAGDILIGAVNSGLSFSIIEFNLVSTSSSTDSSVITTSVSRNFNRIIHLEYPSRCVAGVDVCLIGTMTVPPGKIWEIKKMNNLGMPEGDPFLNDQFYDVEQGTDVYVGGYKIDANINSFRSDQMYFIEGTYKVFTKSVNADRNVARFIIAEHDLN